MLGIKVKSAVKCHLFTLPWLPGEPAPTAEKIPRGNTALSFIEKPSTKQTVLILHLLKMVEFKSCQGVVLFSLWL